MPKHNTLKYFYSKIRQERQFCMKKLSSKVDVKPINFTRSVYNNFTINVNTDNSNNNKLKNLRNNLLYVIECCLLIKNV